MLAGVSRSDPHCSSRLSSLSASPLTPTCKLKTRVTREIHYSPPFQPISARVLAMSFIFRLCPATASQPRKYTLDYVIGRFGRRIQYPEWTQYLIV